MTSGRTSLISCWANPSRLTQQSRQPGSEPCSQTMSQPSGDAGSGSTSPTLARVQNGKRSLDGLFAIQRMT